MTYGAYGLVEVVGEANGILVTAQDTKCGGHALIFVGGDVAAVTAAVESVREDPPCEVIEAAVISNPSQEMIDIVEMFRNRRK